MKKFALVLIAVCAMFVATSSAQLWETIWAGQNEYAGEFMVWTEGTNLKVKIFPVGDWKITESHVEVVTAFADFPTNNGGNPRAGHFRWAMSNPPSTNAHEYTIPYADIPAVPGQMVYIAIHCVMVKTDMYGMIIQEETGWGGPCGTSGWVPGTPLPAGFYKWGGNAWGYYFEFTLPLLP